MLRIPYQSEDFPPSSIPNEIDELLVTWDEILWAAVTVGRPNLYNIFQFGDASQYEAIFRWSMVRMALEQSSPTSYRLRRTDAAKALDPTEKGAINYFLGMTICKLFASRFLNTPWLLHLDIFRSQLQTILNSRSRPDLIGKANSEDRWHAFECKGRLSLPNNIAKQKAKAQAERVVSVSGIPCTLHVGAITHFKHDVLQFYWRDPTRDSANELRLPFNPDIWRYYFAPVLEIISQEYPETARSSENMEVRLDGPDLTVGVHGAVANLLLTEKWKEAQSEATLHAALFSKEGYQADGLMIKAGDSWLKPFEKA